MSQPAAPNVRAATSEDREWIWRWRNDPRVRRGSADSAEIPWEGHLAWFERTIRTDRVLLLVAELDGSPSGVARFDLDLDGGGAEVSIYLDPERIGTGLGGPLLDAAIAHLRRARPETKRVRARVRPDNPASLAIFRRAGFAERHLLLTLDIGGGERG